MGTELIHLDHISKKYGKKLVLSDINLSVMEGQSIALLGTNGSGKSTLLRILCGLTKITSGGIKYSSALKFNYVPEHFPKMNITAKQYIEHMGLIEKMPIQRIRDKSKELFETFLMDQMIDIPMKHLSKGTLQKVAVIQTLITKPDILLLDEPLSGQDIKSQKHFITMMKELNNQGVTIVMSCHEMYLVNQISNEVYEIVNQKLEPFYMVDANENNYDVLIFQNNGNQLSMNASMKDAVKEAEINQSEIRLVVLRDKSNEVILHMIRNDFRLVEMRGMEK
jgi:ABC-type multidrug transport system ATPase subunit